MHTCRCSPASVARKAKSTTGARAPPLALALFLALVLLFLIALAALLAPVAAAGARRAAVQAGALSNLEPCVGFEGYGSPFNISEALHGSPNFDRHAKPDLL